MVFRVGKLGCDYTILESEILLGHKMLNNQLWYNICIVRHEVPLLFLALNKNGYFYRPIRIVGRNIFNENKFTSDIFDNTLGTSANKFN